MMAGASARRMPARTRAAPARAARRTQEERRAETRARLIKAAIEVLGESGYAHLTISKVTQRAGLTNGAMQHHFPSRDELMLAVFDAVYPVLEIPFDAIAAERLEVRERVATVVDRLWAIYSRPEYLAIWDVALGSRGDRKLWTRLRSYQRDVATRMRAQFVALFLDLDIDPDDVEKAFSLTVSHMRGVALQAMFGPDSIGAADLSLVKEVAFDQLMKRVRRA
jgi:AcrR family transcriptional regulator